MAARTEVARIFVTLSALAVLAAGCSPGEVVAPSSTPSPTLSGVSPTPTGSSGEVPAGWKTCANDRFAYSIAYPAEWFTTHDVPENACRWFDPDTFQVETDSEGPVTALSVKNEATVSFADASKGEEGTGTRYLRNEPTTVGGRSAVVFETVLEEDSIHPKGTRTYGYVLDRDGKAFLVLTTHLPGSPASYDENKRVVDQAVKTVRFTGAGE